MTVNYNFLIANSSPLNRIRLLLRWRGSIWKALLSEFTIWIICFTTVGFIYNQWLTESEQKVVARLAKNMNTKMDMIPLNFILSFFVTAVVSRWQYIFQNIGFIDNLALQVAYHIPGNSDRVRMIRRNIVRYAVQAQLVMFRDVSTQVRRRFPTLESTVTANFVSEAELANYLNYDSSYTLARYWIPIAWAQNAIRAAKTDGLTESDATLNSVLLEWRNQLSQVINYDWVPLPLMYPQLVILAVHSYFYLCLISRQISFLDYQQWELGIIEENISKCIFNVLQFIFYVGWLRVAEALLNPMGEDDDDFETNFLLDRNLKMGLAIVDKGADHHPPLVEDPHWSIDQPLLYSENSRPVHPFYGSAVQLGSDRKEFEQKENLETKGEAVKMVPLEGDLEETPARRKPTRVELPRMLLDKCKSSSLANLRKRLNSNGNLTPKSCRSATPDSMAPPPSNPNSPYFTHVGFTSINEETKEKLEKDSQHLQLPGYTPIEDSKLKTEPKSIKRTGSLDDIQEEETPKIEKKP